MKIKNKWFSNGVQCVSISLFRFVLLSERKHQKVQVYYLLHSFVRITWFTSKILALYSAQTLHNNDSSIQNITLLSPNIACLTLQITFLTFYFWSVWSRRRETERKRRTRNRNKSSEHFGKRIRQRFQNQIVSSVLGDFGQYR